MSTGPDNPSFTPPPPGGDYPLGPGPDTYGLANQVAQERAQLPAIFLIVVGVLNLLWALYMVFSAFAAGMMTQEQYEAQQQAQQEMLAKIFPNLDMTEQKAATLTKTQTTAIAGVWAGLALLCALLTLMAGIEMRALRYYGLAVIGSLAACLPCLSCMGCCGVGEIVGIWALIVLLNPEVRAGFR